MKTNKSKLILQLIILVTVLTALAFLVFNENGIIKFLKLRNELHTLEEEIEKSEEKLISLKKEIDSLKTEMHKIEKVAREKYNMMLPNENALRIEEK